MAVLFPYLAIALSFFFFFFFVLYRRRSHNSSLTSWPILGMLPALIRGAHRIQEFTFELLKENDGTFEFKGPIFANLDYLVTSDTMNVHHILSGNFANYPKGSEFKSIFEPLGDGIFNTDSDIWKAQRKTIHSLISGKFHGFMEKAIHNKVVKSLIPVLEYVSEMKIEVDMQDVFQRLSYDTISLLVLGIDPGSLSKDFPIVSSQKAFDNIWGAIANRHLLPESLWKLKKLFRIGTEKNLVAAVKALDKFLYQCISTKQEEQRRRAQVNEDMKEESFDMLTASLEQQKEAEGHVFYSVQFKKQLRDDVLNLMVAGRDTISSALTWFFWVIACNPEAETKIYEEIKRNLQGKEVKEWNLFSIEEVSNLVYLHGALCETLRLYPPVHMERKSAIQPDILPTGHHVGKNANILLSFYAMGRMETIWGKDCLEFKPERWISDDGKIPHVPSYKFVAFNAGPRTCLGKNIAIIEMKMIAAAIIWNYRIQLVDNFPVMPSLSVILQMKHGLKVRVLKRAM